MKNVWILVECLSGIRYAFNTREKAENVMMETIKEICKVENISPDLIGDIRAYCEKSDWHCFDMYLEEAEWQTERRKYIYGNYQL